MGRIFHRPIKARVLTVLTVRSMLRKNAITACTGAVNGLTRNRTIRSDVAESMAERMMPKRRLFMTGGKQLIESGK
jgi:hypothetical protein